MRWVGQGESGDERVVEKDFELLFNAVPSEEQAKDPFVPRRWQSKGSLRQGVGGGGGGAFQEIPPPPLMESVPEVGDLHPMTPGSVIVASVRCGP